jgi:hypothetical protein
MLSSLHTTFAAGLHCLQIGTESSQTGHEFGVTLEAWAEGRRPTLNGRGTGYRNGGAVQASGLAGAGGGEASAAHAAVDVIGKS